MELLKSEKQRTEKASMIYNWLRTPPRHICEFHYGSPCLRQEKRQAHIPAVSPQTRQDTKGTCQSQAGTWSPFMRGTLLNTVPQWVCWAVMEPCPALLGGSQTANTFVLLARPIPVLPTAAVPVSCQLTTGSKFYSFSIPSFFPSSLLPRNHTKSEDVAWKKRWFCLSPMPWSHLSPTGPLQQQLWLQTLEYVQEMV